MSLVYVGGKNLSVLCPTMMKAIGTVSLAISAAFNGAVALNASLSLSPPTLAFYLAALAQLEAQISAAIELNLPAISFSLEASVALIAQLELAFGFLLILETLLDAEIGIFAYSYAGIANQMGAAVTTNLATRWPNGAPTNANATAILFGAEATIPPPIAEEQMKDFFGSLSFGSGLEYAGSQMTLKSLLPSVELAVGEGHTGIQAQLEGALALKASLALTPPTLAVSLDALVAFAASLKAQGVLALPSVSFALAATASLSASLSAKFSALIALGVTLSQLGAKFFAYTYTGPANGLGPAITTALASTWGDTTTPTSTPCVATLLGANDSITANAMLAFFSGASL